MPWKNKNIRLTPNRWASFFFSSQSMLNRIMFHCVSFAWCGVDHERFLGYILTIVISRSRELNFHVNSRRELSCFRFYTQFNHGGSGWCQGDGNVDGEFFYSKLKILKWKTFQLAWDFQDKNQETTLSQCQSLDLNLTNWISSFRSKTFFLEDWNLNN